MSPTLIILVRSFQVHCVAHGDAHVILSCLSLGIVGRVHAGRCQRQLCCLHGHHGLGCTHTLRLWRVRAVHDLRRLSLDFGPTAPLLGYLETPWSSLSYLGPTKTHKWQILSANPQIWGEGSCGPRPSMPRSLTSGSGLEGPEHKTLQWDAFISGFRICRVFRSIGVERF